MGRGGDGASMTDRPTTPPPDRPTGQWATTVALALIAAGFSVINPALLIFVPLALLLIALEPRRSWLVLIGVVLLVATFVGQSSDALWWFGRGWALMLSAWFVVAVALLPQLSFIMRAIAAVGGAAASAALLFLANRTGWESLDWTVGTQLRNGAADMLAFWGTRFKDQAWVADMTKAVYAFAEWQASAYPALLGIASLASLALAWWLWRRLAVQDPRPLGRLRDFRFSDQLVWIVVVGALLVVFPFNAPVTRTGANLLTFMAALYALRGAAVMLWLFGSPGILGVLFGAIVFLMLYPVVMATTLMVGLTDTWLDLRARRTKEREQG